MQGSYVGRDDPGVKFRKKVHDWSPGRGGELWVVAGCVGGGAKSLVKLFTGRGARERATQEGFWALKDVLFEVKRGDRLGIIGRNRTGKYLSEWGDLAEIRYAVRQV